jgi:hypothetical protein
MAVTATVNSSTPMDATQNEISVYGTLTFSGNYGSAGSHGDTLDLSQLGVPSSLAPNCVFIYEEPIAGTSTPANYGFIWCRGTSQANGRVTVALGGAEITQGSAYPAALTNGQSIFKFNAFFPSL